MPRVQETNDSQASESSRNSRRHGAYDNLLTQMRQSCQKLILKSGGIRIGRMFQSPRRKDEGNNSTKGINQAA